MYVRLALHPRNCLHVERCCKAGNIDDKEIAHTNASNHQRDEIPCPFSNELEDM